MAYYDIGEVFQKIEEDMIASMMRNLKRHLNTENEEGINYAMWQAEQLAALNEFKRKAPSLFGGYFSTINDQIEEVLKKAHETGKMDQEIQILEAIREGWSTALKPSANLQGAFFRINDRKLKALIKSVNNDMKKAETAMLRRANDEYRKILFNSQAYYNTGAGTLPQCVDMATKDFLAKGIDCIEYKNGARVGIDSYARMAIRTATTRAYLLGESAKRDEWGISTVIVNKRGVACPKCLQYVGRVFYDDVWGSAPIPSPEIYPRLSSAIAGGLYHPNCKDTHTTYFEGVTTPPKPMTAAEKKEASRVYNLEQQQRYNERQIRKYKRLYNGSVDPENRDKYYKKLSTWQDEQKRFVKANGDVLRRRYENEVIFDQGLFDGMKVEYDLAKRRAQKAKPLTNSGNSDIISSKNSLVTMSGVDVTVTEKQFGFEDGYGGTMPPVDAVIYTTPDGTQFVFPKNYDKAHQTMTPEQAISAWERVPQRLRAQAQKTIEFVDYYNPRDVIWQQIYKNFSHSYATGGDNITFYRYDSAHNMDWVVRTYCHEAAHYIDTKLATTASLFSEGTLWRKAMSDDEIISKLKSCTGYGENAPTEDFAESIAEYIMNKATFSNKFPNRAAILANII